MLLAIDSSTQWLGLALYDGATVLSQMVWRSKNNHTIELSTAIMNMLGQNDIPVTELSAIGVALGPGSYTCLRVGLAVVKGIALGRKIPVIGIPTLDVLVSPIPADHRPVIGALIAGRGRYAYSFYKSLNGRWVSQNEPALTTAAELSNIIRERTLVCGEFDAAARLFIEQNCSMAEVLSPARSCRYPSYLAELAWQRYKRGEKDDIVTLTPIYTRVDKAIPE